MNALQNQLLERVLDKIGDLGEIRFAGIFPDQVHLIGNRFPAVLVQDGDHPEYRMESGRRVQYLYLLHLHLYHNLTTGRVDVMNRITDLLIGSVLSDEGIDPAVTNLQVVSVEKGEVRNEPADFHQPGVYQNLSVRRITFSMLIRDTR